MATVLTVKEKGLEVIVVSGSPYDTSALPIKAYVVIDPESDSDSDFVEVGSLANGEDIEVDIEIPCFFERATIGSGSVYSVEIVADPEGANPIVLASDEDLFVRIEQVVSL